MLKVAIIGSSETAELQADLSKEFECSGISTVAGRAAEKAEVGLAVGIASPRDPDAFFEIGRAVGAKIPVLVIANTGENLPRSLAQQEFVAREEPGLIDRVMARVRDLLGVEVPTHHELVSLDHFLSWLSDDWNRLHSLDGKSFEHLVGELLERSSLRQGYVCDVDGPEMSLRYPELGISWEVACRASSAQHPIGMSVVQDVYQSCLQKRHNFTFLVSNSRFTKAAIDWASRCVPAVHLLDADIVKAALIAASDKHGRRKKASTRDRPLLLAAQASAIASVNHYFNQAATWLFGYGPENTRVWNIPRQKERQVATWRDSRTPLRICFVSACQSAERFDKLYEKATQLNLQVATVGENCTTPAADWPQALRQSNVIFFVTGHGTSQRSYQQRLLQLVANYWDPNRSGDQRFLVLGQDDLVNRLSLPVCLRDAEFVQPSEEDDWLASAEERVEELSQLVAPEKTHLEVAAGAASALQSNTNPQNA